MEKPLSVAVGRAGRNVLALLASAVILCAVLVSAPHPVHADELVAQPGELVVNGGGEQPVTVGWQGGLGRATHGVSGYPPSNIVDSTGLTGETYPGETFLLTGVGASSVATQSIDLTPSAAAIDNGNVDAVASVYIGGYARQQDQAQVTYTFYDDAGEELAAADFGPVTASDRGGVSGFVHFAEAVRLPVGTRQAVITITTQRFTAPANDAYVDNVSLILDAPSPVAAPDTESTVQGAPVVIAATVNDTAGAGADVVPASLRLLDGGTEVTVLVTADGTYSVDVETGEVEFRPAADFVGTTSAVRYRIVDSSGQIAESTITVDVAPRAPGLTLVKSASPADAESFQVGTEIVYSFMVTNTGNVRVDDIAIIEESFTGHGAVLVAACPQEALDPGAQMTCTASYELVQADIDNQGVSNTASVSGVPDGSDERIDSDLSTFDIPVEATPALSLVKTADAVDATAAGHEIEYSFLATNTGNVTLRAFDIVEESFTGTGGAPEVSCPTAELPPGAFTTCTAVYALTQVDVDAGSVVNTARAEAAYGGQTVGSDPSSATVTITPQPDMTFVKTATTDVVTVAGQSIDYLFRVTNTGNVTLEDVSILETEFSGAGDLGQITCPSSTVLPGDVLECTARYTVVVADLNEHTLYNSAAASATAGDNSVESDTSTVEVAVEQKDASLPPGDSDDSPGTSDDDTEDPRPVDDSDRLPSTGGDVTWFLLATAILAVGFGMVLRIPRRGKRGSVRGDEFIPD